MTVALVHFHLRRGGVTSVMLRQAACLAARGVRAILIAGTPPEVPVPIPVHVVPGLDYDSSVTEHSATSRDLADTVESTLKKGLPGCDLIHVHNPFLRKNRRLVGSLKLLQRRGYRLLVQIHDFAEDFRPSFYDPAPYLVGCDYAVINPRDRRRLIAAGLEPGQVHYLPNPVAEAPFEPPSPCDDGPAAADPRPLALAPVRAIRRKNLGEAILLSRFLPEERRLAVTLPPTSDADWPAYEAWKQFAVKSADRITFDIGLTSGLDDLYRQSFCTVTTSVKEGFGYSYLDPLVRGLPVVGRAVPAAVEIFGEAGIAFDGLYSEIRIPRTAVSKAELDAAVGLRLAAMKRAYASAFRRTQTWNRIETRLRTRFSARYVDFGALDEPLQAQVLSRFAERKFAEAIADLNPFLSRLFFPRVSNPEALGRRETVLSGFSVGMYGQLLAAVYEKAVMRPGSGTVDKAKLVQEFLEPDAFFLAAS